MRRGILTDTLIRMSAPFYRWRARSVRKAALTLYSEHGVEAVAVLRAQIGSCRRYSQRKRLYRLHDEIARQRPGDC